MTVLAPNDVHRVGFAGPGEHVWRFDPYEGAAEEIALVATDAWPPRDRVRVAHYRSIIARGRRPAVVALFPPDGFAGYLLDGHHRLAAYGTQDAPPVVALSPMRPFQPDNEQVRRAVPAFVDAVSEYHRHEVIGLLDRLRTYSLGVTSEADELARTGRSAAAAGRYRDYLAYQERLLADEALDGPATTRIRLAMAENRHKLGRTLLRQGQRDEGEALLRAALADHATLLGERHPVTVELARELHRRAPGSAAHPEATPADGPPD
jgi:hypothetical protein